jgi:CPA2 family monovalent cation:H+ antiporter-2
MIAGFGLAQIGEFSFVLAISGKAAGLMTENGYQMFLSVTILTMLATPFLIKYAPMMSMWIVSKFPSKLILSHADFIGKAKQSGIKEHVIIIGFGFNGRNLARVLKETGINYIISETNSDTVKEMKKAGEPIYYGDASGQEILIRLGIKKARALVCTVPDPFAQRTIISVARQLNPCVHIIVRTRFISSIDELKALGANEVIPEEFETAIELFSTTLQLYKYPAGIISEMAERVRKDNYSALRKSSGEDVSSISTNTDCLPEIEFDGYLLNDNSLLLGKTISELNIRQVTGITIIAIRREKEVLVNPSPDFKLLPGDIILFTGKREAMDEAMIYFREMTTDNIIEE